MNTGENPDHHDGRLGPREIGREVNRAKSAEAAGAHELGDCVPTTETRGAPLIGGGRRELAWPSDGRGNDPGGPVYPPVQEGGPSRRVNPGTRRLSETRLTRRDARHIDAVTTTRSPQGRVSPWDISDDAVTDHGLDRVACERPPSPQWTPGGTGGPNVIAERRKRMSMTFDRHAPQAFGREYFASAIRAYGCPKVALMARRRPVITMPGNAKRAHPGGHIHVSDKRTALQALVARKGTARLTPAQRAAAEGLAIDITGGEAGQPRGGLGMGLRERIELALATNPPLLDEPPQFARECTLAGVLDDVQAGTQCYVFDVVVLASHTCVRHGGL